MLDIKNDYHSLGKDVRALKPVNEFYHKLIDRNDMILPLRTYFRKKKHGNVNVEGFLADHIKAYVGGFVMGSYAS